MADLVGEDKKLFDELFFDWCNRVKIENDMRAALMPAILSYREPIRFVKIANAQNLDLEGVVKVLNGANIDLDLLKPIDQLMVGLMEKQNKAEPGEAKTSPIDKIRASNAATAYTKAQPRRLVINRTGMKPEPSGEEEDSDEDPDSTDEVEVEKPKRKWLNGILSGIKKLWFGNKYKSPNDNNSPKTEKPEGVSKTKFYIFGALLVLVVIAGLVFFLNNGSFADSPVGITMNTASSPESAESISGQQLAPISVLKAPTLFVGISLASLSLFLIQLVLFLETYSRGERALLDWWIVPLSILVLVFRDLFTEQWWTVFMTTCTLLLAIATFNNESEEEGRFSFIDLTSLMVISGSLLIVYYGKIDGVAYPSYIPIWMVWILFIISIFKEMARTISLALVALTVGVIAALTLNPWVIVGSFSILVAAITLGGHQGWVHTNRHSQEVGPGMKLGGRDLRIIVPWDNLLVAIFVFTFLAFSLYGNFPILQFSR